MKIVETRLTKVRVPTNPDAVNSLEWGDDGWSAVPKFIVELITDEGLVGLGETYRGIGEDAVRTMATALQGKNPLQLCWQSLPQGGDLSTALVGYNSPRYRARDYELRQARSPASDAFEMAVLDLAGKALGVPAHRLLGSAYRERVPVDFWFGRRSPEDAGRRTRLAVKMGYHGLKMKNALEDPTVAQVEAIVEAGGPGFSITVDPNERFYRPAEAIRLAKELERFRNVLCFEDPMPKWNLDWYRLFREKTTIPVALHLGSPTDVINAIKAEACDYMNLGGSMLNFVRCAAMAEAAGILIWHGSGVDLGILEASYVHVSACARNCVLPGDVFGRLIREHDLLATPLAIAGGHVAVPPAPGLGVELDRDALGRYRME
ncbi:MAG: mandelate racemase/muconate lactonizing enzyme family protein [Chloroflexi bacterium]|nr:mandelate racemase/muconate lactonizing enzyme family protein [Chloroflexota bacterium]